MRLTVAMSDGKRLYFARYASDRFAPTLYYRRTEVWRVLVPGTLDRTLTDWIAILPGSFAEITPEDAILSDFTPSV
jgi:predicted glutamine amidotransferase